MTKEIINRFQSNVLDPVLFERLDLIKLSRSKYFVTNFVDFSVYRQSFASLLNVL